MKTIAPGLLDEIVRRLVAEFQPEQIILFGSHAWGTPTKDSDLDLWVIVSASNESPHDRAVRAYGCLQDMTVPKDLFVKTRAEAERYRHVKASLAHKVFERGRVLYG